jgi:hypothetical protein
VAVARPGSVPAPPSAGRQGNGSSSTSSSSWLDGERCGDGAGAQAQLDRDAPGAACQEIRPPFDAERLRSSKLVQSDFGGYDARFLGLTIHLGSPRSWQLLFATAPQDLDEALVEARAEGPEAFFEALALATVWRHELRHSHDALFSPASSELFWRRFMLGFYGMQIATLLGFEGEGQVVPILIPKWLRADEATRASWLEGWREYTGEPITVTPALAAAQADPELRAVLRAIVNHSDGLRSLLLGPSSYGQRIQSQHLFEASALLVQVSRHPGSIRPRVGRPVCRGSSERAGRELRPALWSTSTALCVCPAPITRTCRRCPRSSHGRC